MDLLIREAQLEDAEAIVSILNPIIKAGLYTALSTPFSVEAEREFILNFPQRGIFHVAVCEHTQKILGFQNTEPEATYTRAFDHVGVIGTYVELCYRRQGIGRSLFTGTFEAALGKGYEKLSAFIRADNIASLAAYLNQGCSIIGTAQRQAKINGLYVDEILLERFL